MKLPTYFRFSSLCSAGLLALCMVTLLFVPWLHAADKSRPDIVGVIKDEQGKPLAGAMVFVYTAAPKQGPGVLCPYCYDDCRKRVTSAADGSFTIKELDPTLKFNLMVTAKGHRPQLVSKVDPAEKPVAATLKQQFRVTDPRQSVRGRVLDAAGKPVFGAVVSIKSISRGGVTRYGSDKEIDPLAVTDEAGLFILNATLPVEQVALEVEARNLAKGVFNSLSSGEAINDLKMTEGVTITGRVLKDGKPVSGVEVGISGAERWAEVYIGNFSTATSEEGRFMFVNIPSKRAYQFYGLMKSFSGKGALLSRVIRLGEDGSEFNLGDLEVKPSYTLGGQIKLTDGKSLPEKTRILLSRDEAWDSQQIELDAQGKFKLEGLPTEPVSLSVRVPDYRLTRKNASLSPSSNTGLIGTIKSNKLDLVIELEPGKAFEPDSYGDRETIKNEPLQGAEARPKLAGDIKVTGRVVDADSGQPLKEFTVTEGRQDQFRQDFTWFPSRTTKHADGNFTTYFSKQQMAPGVLIEAKGYFPQASKPVTTAETNFTFSMKKGGLLAGVVKLPDGKPAADVHVYLTDARNGVYIVEDGHVRSELYRGTKSTRTDAAGNFSFEPKVDAFTLCVHEPAGFAEIRVEDFLKKPVVQMQALAKVEGKLMIGNRPGGNEVVRLSQSYVPYLYHPRHFSPVSLFMTRTTKVDGTFVFDYIPPLPVEISHSPKVRDARTGTIPVSQDTAFVLKPGETRTLTLGGQGRPVVGKFVINGYDEKIDWRADVQSMELMVPEPDGIPSLMTIGQEYARATRSAKKEDFAKLREDYEKQRNEVTEKLIAFYRTEAGLQHHFSKKKYALNFQQDGSFRVEDVPAGKYMLKLELRESGNDGPMRHIAPLIASLNKEIEVPTIPGGRNDEPLDIGVTELSARGSMKSGKAAPEFSVKTLEDKAIKLSDFKGRYVLLDFWAVWCGPCVAETPYLKEAYALIKDNPKFAMIGLSLDPEKEAPIEYAKKNQLGWIQGFLGDWSKTDIPNQYGVQGIPSIMLIGPDGKIVASGLRGPAIKSALQGVINK